MSVLSQCNKERVIVRSRTVFRRGAFMQILKSLNLNKQSLPSEIEQKEKSDVHEMCDCSHGRALIRLKGKAIFVELLNKLFVMPKLLLTRRVETGEALVFADLDDQFGCFQWVKWVYSSPQLLEIVQISACQRRESKEYYRVP